MQNNILIACNSERAQARMEQMRQQIERRAYALFTASGFVHGQDLDHWLLAERELTRHLPSELDQDDRCWVVRIEVPGFRPEDLELDIGDGRIVVFGQNREPHPGVVVFDERGGADVCRSICLPRGSIADQITAHLERGVLVIRIPKAKPS